MTDKKATRTTFMRTVPALHEAEVGWYEAENDIIGGGSVVEAS